MKVKVKKVVTISNECFIRHELFVAGSWISVDRPLVLTPFDKCCVIAAGYVL